MYALGAGSQITGNNVTANISGTFASAARAEGGTISLTNSNLTTSGTSAADTDPTSAARAMSGGVLQISGSTLTGTGQRGTGFSVQDAGSHATVSDFDRFGGRKPRKRGFHLQWRPGHRYQQHADVDRL